MIADVLSVMRAVDATVSFLLRPGYHRLARAGIFKRWLPKQIEIRVISVNQPEGTELHLRLGRRVIGRWLPGHNGWQIRRPFRLFVDEAALPENKAEVSGVPPTLC